MVDVLLAARHKAMNLLARREHSRKELINKLASRDFESDVIETTLDRLAAENLQSDERFTEAFVTMRRKKGQGPVRILKDLQERGINSILQETYVDPADQCWRQCIREVRIKKFGADIPDDYQQRAKQARFLQYRGFTSEQIRNEVRI